MQTSTQVYRQLKVAEFSEQQIRALIAILQSAGIVEPEPPESELERLEEYLLAEPFETFLIEMAGGKSFRIQRSDQCGFTRNGSVLLRDVSEARWSVLNSELIGRVQRA